MLREPCCFLGLILHNSESINLKHDNIMSSSPLLIDGPRSTLLDSTSGSRIDPRNTLSLGKRLSLSVEEDSLVILGMPLVPRYFTRLLNILLR